MRLEEHNAGNAVPTLNLTIERTRTGENLIVYPRREEELIPPVEYEDRLTWIKASFDKFLTQVQELEALRKTSHIK
jgi:hypothetical protein